MIEADRERHVADTLWMARRSGRPASPDVTAGLNGVEAAYRVQRLHVARRIADGGRRVGRKIGLTSQAVRRQLGVDQPTYGVLFADMDASGPQAIATTALTQPRIEAEIAFVLARAMPANVTPDGAAAFVDHAVVAAEIVDSAIADWRIGLIETVADNGSAGLFALSPERLSPARFDPAMAKIRMTRNGQEVSNGSGADCLGGPLNALSWLARAAAARGDGLQAGEIVLSGALGPMVAVAAGDHFRIEVDGASPLDVRFAEA